MHEEFDWLFQTVFQAFKTTLMPSEIPDITKICLLTYFDAFKLEFPNIQVHLVQNCMNSYLFTLTEGVWHTNCLFTLAHCSAAALLSASSTKGDFLRLAWTLGKLFLSLFSTLQHKIFSFHAIPSSYFAQIPQN